MQSRDFADIQQGHILFKIFKITLYHVSPDA